MRVRTQSGPIGLAQLSAVVFGAALLVALPGSSAFAQDQQDQNESKAQPKAEADKSHQPPILVIYKEEVKPGRAATHEKVESMFAQTYAKVDGTRPYLAMTSVTGPNEAWFVEPVMNFKELEAERKATDSAPSTIKAQLDQLSGRETDEITAAREIVTLYREDLSYNPNFDIPHMRYVEVFKFNVRPGHGNDLVEAAKLVKAAHDKAKDGMQWAMYQVVSGGEMGVFYAFRPVDSLEKIDPTDMTNDKAYDNALGDEGHKKLSKLSSDGYLSVESAIFAFNPKMSYAPPAFAAADSFWAPKGVQMAAVGTTGKAPAVKKTKKQQ